MQQAETRMGITRIFFFRFFFWMVVIILGLHYVLFVNPGISTAEGDSSLCPSIVTDALNATTNSCGNTHRNQVCYGHNLVHVEPQPFVSQLTFASPGDTVPTARVRSIRGSAL